MIIDNTYFVDEIFLPHAKPSVTDDITAVSNDITSFINTYSEECLNKCLGFALFKEFSSQLDKEQTNGLKTTADDKWNKLLNGTEYTLSDGELVHWKGIRSKTGDTYNKSFLADYVYYFYEKNDDDDRVGIGNVKQVGKNAVSVSKTPKVISAWRRFFNAVQGGSVFPSIYTMQSNRGVCGLGIDWMQQNQEITLYKFITDTNETTPGTYDKFKPFAFTNANQFDL